MFGFLLYFLWFVTIVWPVESAVINKKHRLAVIAGVTTVSMPLGAWVLTVNSNMHWGHALLTMLVMTPILQIALATALVSLAKRNASKQPIDG